MKTNETQNQNQKINARILVLVAGGMDIKQAFDTVLGQGSFVKMAGEAYDSIKA